MEALFTTPRGTIAAATLPSHRRLASGEKVHFSEAGTICQACLCDLSPSTAWLDSHTAWEDRADRCV